MDNIPSGGRKLNYSTYSRIIEERYFQMSPLISAMRTNASITLIATCTALYLIVTAHEACSKSSSFYFFYTGGVGLFSTGISEECPRLAAVACEKVNRVRDGGRCRPPLPT
jgi:hypothetical protein